MRFQMMISYFPDPEYGRPTIHIPIKLGYVIVNKFVFYVIASFIFYECLVLQYIIGYYARFRLL